MSRVFLMGPLAWTPLLELVLGRTIESAPVALKNLGHGPSQAFPFPHIEDGARATGIAVDLDDAADFDALSFFAAALGAHPVPKHGEVGGKRLSGILFLADRHADAPPMPFETWIQEWGDLARVATQEIMSYHGRMPPSELHWRLPMILSRAVAARAAVDAAKDATLPAHRSHTRRDAITCHRVEASHEGFFLTRTYHIQHPRFDGTMSDILRREVFVAADAVIVLPYDPVRDRVLLVEQFRLGPFGRGDPFPWVLEPVAGRVDAGETPEQAARRECQEEAGLSLSHMEHVTSHYCSPGASTEFYHCYLALTDLPDCSEGQGGLETEAEDIRTHVLSFDDAMGLLTSKEANIGPMILLLLWLERERPRLRSLA
ncbi:MAG: NUDIX domain-containing protein [Pseudomonadota bacterium]